MVVVEGRNRITSFQSEIHNRQSAIALDTLRARLLDFFRQPTSSCPDGIKRKTGYILKRETIAVGAICLLLGGLIGYITGTQVAFKQIKEAAQSSNQQEFAVPSSTTPSSIPETAPTVTTSADLEALKKALEAAPQNLSLLMGLANKLYDAGRYQDAIPYYRRALKLDPHNVNVSTDLGTALFYAGQPDAAIAQLNESLQIDPNHVQTLHNLVIVNLQGKKDVNAAKEALDRLKTIDPNNPSIPGLQGALSPQGASQANPRQTLF